MKVTWGRRARRDLRELVTYIADDSVRAAERVAARILKSAASLAKAPRTGRPGRIPGTRERVVARTPYILAYQIVSSRVRILRVYHGARKWPANF